MEHHDVEHERGAFVRLEPAGFFIRHPPSPDELDAFITPDASLFQTIHMGPTVVDVEKWKLVISGLVEEPYALTLSELRQLPAKTITSFHECYGSPLLPPTKALWRVGNVRWTGVPLRDILARAKPHSQAKFVWSDGLDRGAFAGVAADRYRKDLPMKKALSPEVLVAYKMNDQPLTMHRGGPVRLIVPGYFGTNSTKWLCRLSVEESRASGPFTTIFYNEQIPGRASGVTRPVWQAQPNSMITRPAAESVLDTTTIQVEGWCWSEDGIGGVRVSADGCRVWTDAPVQQRVDYGWQRFSCYLELSPGPCELAAQATSLSGDVQPLAQARNHVHRVPVTVM